MTRLAARRRSRHFLITTAACLLAGCAGASARTLETCEARAARPSLDLAVTGGGTDVRRQRAIVDANPDDEVLVRNGLGIAATGEIPVSPRFGVRVESGRSYLGIERVTLSDANHVDTAATTDIGRVDLWRLGAGIVRHVLTGRRLCGYVAASAGLYRFSYGGYRARDGGIAGTLGFELSSSAAISLLLELQLNAVGNGSRAPLAAETVFLLNASAGARFRF